MQATCHMPVVVLACAVKLLHEPVWGGRVVQKKTRRLHTIGRRHSSRRGRKREGDRDVIVSWLNL